MRHILAEERAHHPRTRGGRENAEELGRPRYPRYSHVLQIRLEDDEVAENMFTTLMGEAVEPRRQFIEDNALNVRNLDI